MGAMPTPRTVLTPEALAMLQNIAASGSFAAAARDANMVPSALTYRVRQLEDALDVLLFDRSSRQARLTEAGAELLREGTRLLADIDAVANRVKRVATGWEPQFTIAVDSIIDRVTVMELCDAFFKLNPPTRVKLRDETLSGTLEALTSGQADLALGVTIDGSDAAQRHDGGSRIAEVTSVAAPDPTAGGAQSTTTVVVSDVEAGERVTATVFRGDELLEVGLVLKPAPLDTCYLVVQEKVDADTARRREAWLGQAAAP